MNRFLVRKFSDVAFKPSKNIDWEGMAKLLVSDEARKEFASLRRAFDEVNHELSTKFSQVFSFSHRFQHSLCSDLGYWLTDRWGFKKIGTFDWWVF